MARSFQKLPSFSNVNAGSTATLELPKGLTYDVIYFNFAGVTLSQLKNLRVEINGKVIQEFADAELLNIINKHYGRGTATATSFPLWFIRPELQTLEQQRMFALGTQDVRTATIRVDIAGDASAPELEAYCVKSNPAPLGMITKIKAYPRSSATAGVIDIDTIPRPPKARIGAVHLVSADIVHTEMELNNTKIYNLPNANAAKLQLDYGRQPQDDIKHTLDFTLEGDISQSLRLQGVQDMRLRPELSKAGHMNVIVEYFDTFDGI